jgi:tRNA-dihydrouridine synthase A
VEADRRLFGDAHPLPGRLEVIRALLPFVAREVAAGVPLKHITRHLLGLYQGQPGARMWRRTLSDPALLAGNDPALILRSAEALEARRAA